VRPWNKSDYYNCQEVLRSVVFVCLFVGWFVGVFVSLFVRVRSPAAVAGERQAGVRPAGGVARC